MTPHPSWLPFKLKTLFQFLEMLGKGGLMKVFTISVIKYHQNLGSNIPDKGPHLSFLLLLPGLITKQQR